MHTDTFVNVAGSAVFVRRWNPPGEQHKTPLFLLHDSLGCVDLWRDFPEQLAVRLRRPIVAYDRLGYGRSSARGKLPSPTFIYEEAETLFPAVRTGLGITDFAVMGHSVGGIMSLVAAAREGKQCQAVVTESAQAFVEERTLTGIERAKELFQQPEQFDRLKRWHGDKARWVLDAWTETWLKADFASWTLGPDLARVHSPVLIIHGDQDEYGSVRFPQFIHEHVAGPSEMHILAECGHVPHRERADEVLELVAQFEPLAAITNRRD